MKTIIFQLNNYKEFLEDFGECKVVFACRSMEEFKALPYKDPDVKADPARYFLYPRRIRHPGIEVFETTFPDAKDHRTFRS